MAVQQAAFRYMGSKWRIAPWIISHFGPHRYYIEVFGGSAAVLLRKPPEQNEVYNDLNGEVFNFFRVVRDKNQVAELQRLLDLTPYSHDEAALSFEPSDDPIEGARRFFVRANLMFGSGSLFEKNPTSSFETRPVGGVFPSAKFRDKTAQLQAISGRFRHVVVENRPALDLIRIHDRPDTLFYLDPPYVSETFGPRHQYPCNMTDDDHRELAAALHQIRGQAIISGYSCALYQELYQDWHMETRKAISFKSTERQECIWIKPGSAAQGRLFD